MIDLKELAKRTGERLVIKTNRRKPESVFDLFLPRAKYFCLIFFILLLFSPLPFLPAGLATTGNNELGKIKP